MRGTVLTLYLKDYTNYTLHRHSHMSMYTFPPATECKSGKGESEKHGIRLLQFNRRSVSLEVKSRNLKIYPPQHDIPQIFKTSLNTS